MSHECSTEDHYRAARELLPKMDDVMRQSIEDLLRQADAGVETDNQIIEIISARKVLYAKFQAILECGDVTMGGNFSPLAGYPSNVPPPSLNPLKYICPESGHNFIRLIQKIGQDPGVCPDHKKPLIPIGKKKGVI